MTIVETLFLIENVLLVIGFFIWLTKDCRKCKKIKEISMITSKYCVKCYKETLHELLSKEKNGNGEKIKKQVKETEL